MLAVLAVLTASSASSASGAITYKYKILRGNQCVQTLQYNTPYYSNNYESINIPYYTLIGIRRRTLIGLGYY